MPYNSTDDSFTQRNFIADFLRGKFSFRRKILRFELPSGVVDLDGNVRCSSWAHWKARSGLSISYD